MMLHALFSWLLATFVIAPLQAEFTQRLQAVEAPAAIVAQVQACMTDGTPALVSRATENPVWGITTTASVALGLADAQSLLAEASPECAEALKTVRPFFEAPES